jgi:hypothetical protein
MFAVIDKYPNKVWLNKMYALAHPNTTGAFIKTDSNI